MKNLKTGILSVLLLIVLSIPAFAYDCEVLQSTIPQGKTGSSITINFKIVPDDHWDGTKDVYVKAVFEDQDLIEESTPSVYSFFPFEKTTEMESQGGYIRHVGKIGKNEHSVSINLKLRRDLSDGYYTFPVEVYDGDPVKNNAAYLGYGELTVWVKKSAEKEEKEDLQTITWELGEGQTTPYAVYPEICNFTLNLRNSGTISASDVTASIICDSDSEKFPYDINETNYNRHFDTVLVNETVSLPYSFAIRPNVYTGYYPIKMEITYREGSNGELKKAEKTFFVHVKNKDKEAEKKQNEFNANDRVKARIIVDSYRTEPEEVYAGKDYALYVTFKNASTSVNATNVLLTFESEKVSESPVFTTMGGSNSVVIDSLPAGATEEVCMHFTAGASVDQRSYTISVSEKYDSPEFKNAEEKVSVTVPVLQVARFNIGNIEVLPGTIMVGEESNVMFSVNNTGKIMLYNVMARFEDPSISTTEAYIGNIKPGASGNVDVMLSGAAQTEGDGHIKVVISYEDEYGEETETEKEIVLYVNEIFDNGEDFSEMDFVVPEEPKWYEKPYMKWVYIGGGAAVLLALVSIIRHRKKKKEMI